jgi:endonuclease YncB( thermonuclease family)
MRAFALGLIFLWISGVLAQSINDSRIRVLDGDTIAVDDNIYRLIGFDAPETGRAKCPKERDLGERAAMLLQAIVNGGNLDLIEVRCSCSAATQGTAACNRGRLCAILKADGVDAANIMIREGMARAYVCEKYRCPKRQGWC